MFFLVIFPILTLHGNVFETFHTFCYPTENPYSRHVPAEPHSRKVTPSQLFDHLVSVLQNLSDFYRIITACNTTCLVNQNQRSGQGSGGSVFWRALNLSHNLPGSPLGHVTTRAQAGQGVLGLEDAVDEPRASIWDSQVGPRARRRKGSSVGEADRGRWR